MFFQFFFYIQNRRLLGNWAEISGSNRQKTANLNGKNASSEKNIFYKKDPTKYLSFDIIFFLIEATQVRLLKIRPVSVFLTEHGRIVIWWSTTVEITPKSFFTFCDNFY